MRLDDIADKAVIVTGASQGIGEAVARGFAEAGARVVVHYRSGKEAADAVVAEIVANNGTAISMPAALDQPDEVERLVSDTAQAFGTVDILINNAGSFPNAALLDISPDHWRRMYAGNVVWPR